MAPSEAQKRAADKYNREHMATLGCKVRKERAEEFKKACIKNDTTPNKVLSDRVEEYIAENKDEI